MSSEQNYLQMRVLLQKHKDNQRIYKEKISEVNLTRAKINDQLQLLKQSYDKKIKSLQQKLENMKLQNETLVRQNVLFKTQIETFQNRLLEKEKIIVVLLNQKRQTLIIANSEKSKSDKTDSNHANDEQIKYFKKQTPAYKDSKEEIQAGFAVKFRHDEAHKEITEVKENPPKKQIGNDQHGVKEIQQTKKNYPQQPDYLLHDPLPATKSKIEQFKRPEISKNQQSSASQLFQSLTFNNQERQQQAQEQRTIELVKRPPPMAHKKKQLPKKVPQKPIKKAVIQPQEHQNLQFHQDYSQSHHLTQQQIPNIAEIRQNQQEAYQHQNVFQQITRSQKSEVFKQDYLVQPFQRNEQELDYNYGHHLQEIDNVRNEEKQIQEYQQQYHPSQAVKKAQSPKFEGESYNNFLHNFISQPPANEANEQLAGASMSPKPVSRKKKAGKKVGTFSQEEHLQQEQSINSTDFFNQLSKHDHQVPHHLDIQQSSIDHNDRDSSLISNEQHYFAEEQDVPKAKPVKMTKKKGKRDQIKVADPSLFE